MSTSLVLTVIGADRPGLVEALSRTVTEHGANWLESRMAKLAGKFAGILRVEVEEAKAPALTVALRALQSQGLAVVVESGDGRAAAAVETATQRTATLHFIGHDRPGIVREISGAIARRGINVDELLTERVSAPMSGEPLFKATVTLRIPPGVATAELGAELDRLAGELQLDLTLTE